jgi:hypothetical protein
MASIQIMLGTNRTSPSEQSALTAYSYDAAWWINDYGGGDNLSDMAKVEGQCFCKRNVQTLQVFVDFVFNPRFLSPSSPPGPRYDEFDGRSTRLRRAVVTHSRR